MILVLSEYISLVFEWLESDEVSSNTDPDDWDELDSVDLLCCSPSTHAPLLVKQPSSIFDSSGSSMFDCQNLLE